MRVMKWFARPILHAAVLVGGLVVGLTVQDSQAQCLADLNHDHTVDASDLGLVLSSWGVQGGKGGGDIDGDGVVNGADLALILSSWGACPSPTWATVLEWAPNASVVTNTTLRNAIIATGLPWRVRDNQSSIEMLLIPPGAFWMGCSSGDQNCGGEEFPLHQVALSNPFYMSKMEVTQAQWIGVMGSNPSYFQPPQISANTSRPVEQVSWDMVQTFNAMTGFRLPTEAEWEYACRAGTTTATYGDVSTIAWHYPISSDQTHVVGGKPANALGLHDTIGNVWEWCQDFYSNAYYASSPSTDPPGPTRGGGVVVRGGGYSTFSNTCRASARYDSTPAAVWRDCGVRVAKNP